METQVEEIAEGIYRLSTFVPDANFMFNQLRDVADPDQLGGIPTSLDRWSNDVAEHMSVIVRKAFEASASLGSDVPGSA